MTDLNRDNQLDPVLLLQLLDVLAHRQSQEPDAERSRVLELLNPLHDRLAHAANNGDLKLLDTSALAGFIATARQQINRTSPNVVGDLEIFDSFLANLIRIGATSLGTTGARAVRRLTSPQRIAGVLARAADIERANQKQINSNVSSAPPARKTGRARRGVFVSYSSSDGGPTAERVVEVLREQGFSVTWDADLSASPPVSIQAWMENAVRERTVVVVVSESYLKAFLSNDFMERLGVRYELGLIRQKVYGGTERCDVAVVVPPGIEMDSLPAVLRQLIAHRFDPSTRAGEEDLVQTLEAFAEDFGDQLSPAAQGLDQVYRTRVTLSNLQTEPLSSEKAYRLARELTERGAGDFELAREFESVVAVLKARGDVRLVRRLSEVCLRTLASGPPVKGDQELKAKVLVAGQAWHLLREHRFSEATMMAEDGTQLADKCRDLRTVARGKRAEARVLLHQAAEAVEPDRGFYLRKAEYLLMIAKNHFRSIGGPTSEELGVCASLHAELQLLRYESTGSPEELAAAVRRAHAAETVLTRGTEPYHWVAVLQARLCLADRRYNEGKELATTVITTADFPEVVARARQVRAGLLLATREKAAALRDLLAAEESLRGLGCEHAADTCWWTIAKHDASKVTNVRLTAADLERIEELAPNPGDRRRAVLEHELRTLRRLVQRSNPDWDSVVTRVQQALAC